MLYPPPLLLWGQCSQQVIESVIKTFVLPISLWMIRGGVAPVHSINLCIVYYFRFKTSSLIGVNSLRNPILMNTFLHQALATILGSTTDWRGNHWSSAMFSGHLHSVTAHIFSGLVSTSSANMTRHRYDTTHCNSEHLLHFTFKPYLWNRDRPICRCASCWLKDVENTTTFSRYRSRERKCSSSQMQSRRHWKVPGALRRLKAMLLNSNRPNGMQSTIFCHPLLPQPGCNHWPSRASKTIEHLPAHPVTLQFGHGVCILSGLRVELAIINAHPQGPEYGLQLSLITPCCKSCIICALTLCCITPSEGLVASVFFDGGPAQTDGSIKAGLCSFCDNRITDRITELRFLKKL